MSGAEYARHLIESMRECSKDPQAWVEEQILSRAFEMLIDAASTEGWMIMDQRAISQAAASMLASAGHVIARCKGAAKITLLSREFGARFIIEATGERDDIGPTVQAKFPEEVRQQPMNCSCLATHIRITEGGQEILDPILELTPSGGPKLRDAHLDFFDSLETTVESRIVFVAWEEDSWSDAAETDQHQAENAKAFSAHVTKLSAPSERENQIKERLIALKKQEMNIRTQAGRVPLADRSAIGSKTPKSSRNCKTWRPRSRNWNGKARRGRGCLRLTSAFESYCQSATSWRPWSSATNGTMNLVIASSTCASRRPP